METTVNIQHQRSHESRERSFGKKKKKKRAELAKQIGPRVKQLTFVFLSYFSYFLAGSCGCVCMR